MATYTDWVRNLDNPNYVGKVRKEKRLNAVYEVIFHECPEFTEYTKNDRLGRERCMDFINSEIRHAKRLCEEDDEYLRWQFGEIRIRITDREGNITEEKISVNF